jgi:hypothetical protein
MPLRATCGDRRSRWCEAKEKCLGVHSEFYVNWTSDYSVFDVVRPLRRINNFPVINGL